jgi:hypothetical protein
MHKGSLSHLAIFDFAFGNSAKLHNSTHSLKLDLIIWLGIINKVCHHTAAEKEETPWPLLEKPHPCTASQKRLSRHCKTTASMKKTGYIGICF